MAVEWWATAVTEEKSTPRPDVNRARRVPIDPSNWVKSINQGSGDRPGDRLGDRLGDRPRACPSLPRLQGAGGGGVHGGADEQRGREAPVHRDEDGQRCADDRESAVETPAP